MRNEISFRHVFFASKENILLEDINICFTKNQLTTLVGPNGGGKSTLLKLILGVNKPTSGQIKRRKGLKIGYMPQKISMPADLPMTVGRFLNDKSLLEYVGIKNLYNMNMATLSGGEMQRVLLAYALKNKPDVLLLDEPTQCLDAHGERQMYQIIFDYQKQTGCCIIMASHDLNFVLARSDNILCLNKHICCQGKPEKVKNNDLFFKVPYIHHHDHIHSLNGKVCACSK